MKSKDIKNYIKNKIKKRNITKSFNLNYAKKHIEIKNTCKTDNANKEISNEEFLNLGAYVRKDKNVKFSIHTFQDTEKVSVEIKPASKRIFKIIPLEKICDGYFELTVSKKIVKPNDRYRFIIYRKNMPPKRVRDAYSMRQDKFSSWSIIYDHYKYKWHDNSWEAGKIREKVSRLDKSNLSPIGSLNIYELNIPSLTQKGTYQSAKAKLKEIKEERFNAIEIMPLENSYGFNWGYDGVDKFAPHKNYGSPDDLKSLIDFAHKLKLNVIIDMVPNHVGFDMQDLTNSGPYTDGCNEFGYKFNFEKNEREVAREYITNAALNWVINYHADGLRLDLTKYMHSDFTMKQISSELAYRKPDAFLIAEDARENDERVTRPFPKEEEKENLENHSEFMKKIQNNQISLNSLGYSSEWDFKYHKQIISMILGHWDFHAANINALDYAILNTGMRVKYPMSHDEIGNIDGTRLITKIFAKEISIFKNIPPNIKHRREQRFAHIAQNILKTLLTGGLDNISQEKMKKFLENNYLPTCTTKTTLKIAYRKALKLFRLAVGKTYSIPGPKMLFQGDDTGEITYFKFFRELSCGYEKLLENKGYTPGIAAFKDSKLGSLKYSKKYQKDLNNTKRYTKDLNTINRKNPALQTGKIQSTITHEISQVHAIHSKEKDNEIFTISNFSEVDYYTNYKIVFPNGKWKEILNTDYSRYGGDNAFKNDKLITSDGYNQTKISLPAYGMLYFKKIY